MKSFLLSIVLLVGTAGPAELERQARKIEGLLMAPCCGANTLAEHESGPAHRMKGEIRELLAEGWTEKRILDHYVEQHGHTILAMPPMSGFNLVAYLVPTIALIVGPVVLWRILRRRTGTLDEVEGAPLPEIDPEYRERLARELGNP